MVSLLGDGVFLVAVAWQAYAIANDPSALAGVGIAASVPQLALFLLGGAISDRLPRRAVLIAADLARAVAVGALALVAGAGIVHLWHLWAAAFVIGAATAFAAPAFDAILPELVPDVHLQQANGLDQFLRPAALRLAGPALGGLVLAVAGTTNAFLFDAATFGISAWCIAAIPRADTAVGDEATEDASVTPTLWADMRDGLRYVRGEVWLWGTFMAATFTYLLFLGPTEVLLPYLVKNELHGGAGSLGIVLGVGGAGALVAAAVTGQHTNLKRPITFMYATWTLATVLVAGYGLATRQWHLALISFGIGAFEAAGTVVWATIKQRLVPAQLLGRVSSIDWFVSTALMPMSFALTPLAVRAVGVRTTLTVSGSVGAVVTAAFLFLPGMRLHDRPTPARDADATAGSAA